MPVREESNESNSKLEFNLSVTLTPVAFEGPLLRTVIVYLTKSVTLTNVTLTVLFTFKSTTGKAVTFSEV